jgi:hypothetical protein
MNNSTITSNKLASASSIRREPSATSKASSIISTTATAGSGRRTSLSDVDKELEDFDIDFDKDDASETENGPSVSKGIFKKSTDENEVKRVLCLRNILTR